MKIIKFFVGFSNLLYSISIVLLCVFTALAFINVIARYVFLKPYAWTEEITTILFVVGIYLNQVRLEVLDKQLSVSYVSSKIKNKAVSKVLFVVQRLVVIGLWSLILKEAVPVIMRNYAFETASVILRIPMWTVYTVVAVVIFTVVLINIQKVLGLFIPELNAEAATEKVEM